MMLNLAQLADSIRKQPEKIRDLTPDQIEWLYKHPEIFLYDKQIAPPGNWRYHWFRAGRGAGKTYASTSWLYSKILNGAREVAIVGPDYSTLIKEILPTFESHFPPKQKPKYNHKDNLYRINNCIVKCYSSDQEIRGNNAEYSICEEVAKWCDSLPNKIQERFDIFDMSVRNKRADPPQIFIASTPKNFPIFTNFIKQVEQHNPLYSMTAATIEDNPYLSTSARQALIDRLGSTRLGRQELYASIEDDVEGSLFSPALLDSTRISHQDFQEISIARTIVAVDPAMTSNANSDETGIIVAALCSNNQIYILEDASGRYSPNQWAQKTIEMYNKYQADRIIAEKNQGGDLVETNLRSVLKDAPIKLIHASKGKISRMEPVCGLWERSKAHMVGYFRQLEYQLTHTTPENVTKTANDRYDAMCYACHELLLNKTYVNRDTSSIGTYL